MMSNEINPEVAQEIANCIFAGQKIQAIKLYREHSGKDLKASKDFIDSLEAELRAKEPGRFTAATAGKGCLGVLVVFGIGTLAVVVVAVMVFAG
jgi:hypothetical protein